MNSNNDSGHAGAVIGASLLMLFFASILIKALKTFFIELGQSFEAFANMAGSFISMLWNVFQVVALVSMTLAGLVCAVYFTIQYYKLVKDGCALREAVQKSLEGFESKLSGQMHDLKNEIDDRVRALDERLTKALAKPEVAPTTEVKPSIILRDLTESERDSLEKDDSQPDEFEDIDTHQEDETLSDDEFVTMSNPY